MMNHVWSTVELWKDSFQGLMDLFALGAMKVFQGAVLPWSCFCHGPHCISHTFLPWLPWHLSMPRPSTWDHVTSQWQHKKQLSDHPHCWDVLLCDHLISVYIHLIQNKVCNQSLMEKCWDQLADLLDWTSYVYITWTNCIRQNTEVNKSTHVSMLKHTHASPDLQIFTSKTNECTSARYHAC